MVGMLSKVRNFSVGGLFYNCKYIFQPKFRVRLQCLKYEIVHLDTK